MDDQLVSNFEVFMNIGYFIIHDENYAGVFEKYLEEQDIKFYVEHEFDYMTFHKALK